VPHAVRLGGVEYLFGDLTGAHLEDFYDDVMRFAQVSGMPTKDQFGSILTLAHQALLAGGKWTGTRDDARVLVRVSDMGTLATSVGTALGFEAVTKGEG